MNKNEFDARQVQTVIEEYSKALDLLDAYDHQTMTRPGGKMRPMFLSMKNVCR